MATINEPHRLDDEFPPLEVLSYGSTPSYTVRPKEWRNGREAGAFLAGWVVGIPEHQALVTVPIDDGEGAALAMIAGGLTVTPFATGEETRSFRVRIADARWGPDPQ